MKEKRAKTKFIPCNQDAWVVTLNFIHPLEKTKGIAEDELRKRAVMTKVVGWRIMHWTEAAKDDSEHYAMPVTPHFGVKVDGAGGEEWGIWYPDSERWTIAHEADGEGFISLLKELIKFTS